MAPGQSPEEVLRLLRVAVGLRRPMAAVYDDRRRLLCPHRLGWNREGQRRVLCYQYGGRERQRPGAPRCTIQLALSGRGQAFAGRTASGQLAHGA